MSMIISQQNKKNPLTEIFFSQIEQYRKDCGGTWYRLERKLLGISLIYWVWESYELDDREELLSLEEWI
ncbi:MAG: hypothetical protein WA919_00795 [Coleofasciculaceae cyanobacterium]